MFTDDNQNADFYKSSAAVIVVAAAIAVAALLTASAPGRISSAVVISANRASNWVSRTPSPLRKKSLPRGACR